MSSPIWASCVETWFNDIIDGLYHLDKLEANSKLTNEARPFRSKKSHKVFVKRCFYE